VVSAWWYVTTWAVIAHPYHGRCTGLRVEASHLATCLYRLPTSAATSRCGADARRHDDGHLWEYAQQVP
jgi:hypothetical protein